MKEQFNILRPYFRGFPIMVLAMVLGYLVASKYLNYTTPMYESTAKLKLADISEGITNINLFKDFDVFATSNKIAGEIEVLKSDILLDKVLDELDFEVEIYRVGKIRSVELYDQSPIIVEAYSLPYLFQDSRFNLLLNDDESYSLTPPVGDQRMGKLGDTLQLGSGQLLIRRNEVLLSRNEYLKVADHYEFEVMSREKQISQVKSNLDVMSIDKDVAVLRITSKSAVPKKAALLANKITEVYIHDYIETKFRVANVTVNFLNDQIEVMNEKLEKAENKIADYRSDRGITNIFQENETNLRKVSQLKIQQTNLRMSLDAIQELESYIKDGSDHFLELAPNFEAFTDLLSTEIVKNIKKLQAEKRDLLLVFTAEDDRVKVIDDKIEDLKNYLIESISNTRKNLEVKYNNLSEDIIDAEQVFKVVPENEKILTILNREFQIYQQSYNFLNEKKIEAEIAQAAKIAFHRVITPGVIPQKPISPNKPIIKIVAVLLGLFGAVAFIFTIHALKARVNDKSTIENRSMIPIAGLTPKLTSENAVFNHFQMLASQLEIKDLINKNRRITLSSFRPSEGAPYNAFQLAKALARQGRKVLLIDTEDRLNLTNVIPGKIYEYGDKLSYLSLNDDQYKCYSKEKLKNILQDVSKGYEVTLVLNKDLSSHMSLMMMSLADVNIAVLDARLTPAKRVIEIDLLKEEYHLDNTHFILNRNEYTPSLFHEIRVFVASIAGKRKSQELSWAL